MQDLSQFTSSRLQTPDAIKQLMHSDGRRISFRFLLVDRHGVAVAMQEMPGSGISNDITAYVDVRKFNMTVDSTRDVPGTANFEFKEMPGITLNPWWHRIQVQVVDWAPDKTELCAVPIGTWRLDLNNRTDLDRPMATWRVTGNDTVQDIGDIDFLHTYTVPGGYPVTTAMENLLRAAVLPPSWGGPEVSGTSWPWGYAGVTPNGHCDHVGPGFPANRLQITPSPALTPSDKSWYWKDNQYAAIKQLCTSIAYWTPYPRANGAVVLAPRPYYAGFQPTSVWGFSTDPKDRSIGKILTSDISQKLGDPRNWFNVIQVISENNSISPPIHIILKNESEASVVSLRRVGPKMKTLQDDSIPDIQTAKLIALAALEDGATVAEVLDIECSIIPFLELHDFISLNIYVADGTVRVATRSSPFEIVAFSIDASTRRMKITARRNVPL